MDNKILLIVVVDVALLTLFGISLFMQIKSYYKYENGLRDTRKAFIISLLACLFIVVCLFLRDTGTLFLSDKTSEIITLVTPTMVRFSLCIIAIVGVMIRLGSKFQFLEAEYWKQKYLKYKTKRKE